MRAVDVDLSKLRYPVLVSPKVDGVRAYVDRRGVVMSRQGKPIPNEYVQTWFGGKLSAGFDGELYVGSPYAADVFTKTVSTVMSAGKYSNALRFGVFDLIPRTLPGVYFEGRYRQLSDLRGMFSSPAVVVLTHKRARNEKELLAFEAKWLDKGYEGIIIRDPLAEYKEHYSTPTHQGYLRLKRFVEGEGEVIGFSEQETNNNAKVDGKKTSHKAGKVGAGVLGSLAIRDLKTGQVFSVGAGFTDGQREKLWRMRETLPGLVVRHRTFPKGAKDRPRFPTFAGFRDRRDL